MTPPELSRCAALGIGGFQVLANGALLLRGFARLPQELAKEGATTRLADLLRTAWVYGMLANLCLSIMLLMIAAGLRAGEPLARQIACAIGVYYVLVGLGTYWFAQGRHPGFLVFSGLGLVLLTTLWLSR